MGDREEPKGQCTSEKQIYSQRHSRQASGQTVYGMDTGMQANNRDRYGGREEPKGQCTSEKQIDMQSETQRTGRRTDSNCMVWKLA